MKQNKLRIILAGAMGRMGRAVVELAGEWADVEIVAGVEGADYPSLGEPIPGSDAVLVSEVLAGDWQGSTVLVDFSLAQASPALVEQASSLELPAVVCTTGHGDDWSRKLSVWAERIPLLWAPNMSRGAAVQRAVVSHLAKGPLSEYDIEVIEFHHRGKRDHPSGTARRLAEVAQGSQGRGGQILIGRGTEAGKRAGGEIGVHAIRAGSIVGRHVVMFAAPGETIEVIHSVDSRAAFAAGALAAARFLVEQPPGLYSMEDVFGMERS